MIAVTSSIMSPLAASSLSANLSSESATIVLSTIFGPEMEKVEPSIRNSNLLPVNAKGEVRLRSVESLGKCGSTFTPTSTSHFARLE